MSCGGNMTVKIYETWPFTISFFLTIRIQKSVIPTFHTILHDLLRTHTRKQPLELQQAELILNGNTPLCVN